MRYLFDTFTISNTADLIKSIMSRCSVHTRLLVMFCTFQQLHTEKNGEQVAAMDV